MKDFLIIYNSGELEKNRYFAESLCAEFKKRGRGAEVVTKEQLDLSDPPHAAINRTRDYQLAEKLEAAGTRVINSSGVCRLGNDKFAAYEYFGKAGLPMLPTRHCTQNREILSDCYPCVSKPAHGHGGRLVKLAQNDTELFFNCRAILKENDSVVIQPLATTLGIDLRCYLLGGKLLYAVKRRSLGDFRANFSLGGLCERVEPTKEEREIVESVNSLIRPDFIGVDIIYNDNKPVLNEIEDAVGCRMLYALKLCDPAALFAEQCCL